MGWVWNNNDDADNNSSAAGDVGEFRGSLNSTDNGGRCATQTVVKSQCRTEEAEPGKFIRKCEKTEQVFRHCAGRPSEMLQSIKEYTEEDVTEQMVKGSFSFNPSSENEPSFFPGLRGDIEAMERGFFGGIAQFFQAAEDMKNEFFKSAHMYDDEGLSSYKKPGFRRPKREASSERSSDGDVDLSGLARDV